VQPIVSWSRKEVFGYEALVRCGEPTLPNPGALLSAAERLGATAELGRAIRAQAARIAAELPVGCALFVNLHARDLVDDTLYAKTSELTLVADRVVLEITERASLDDLADLSGRAAELRRLGFRIAVDDLGAGYAGLTSFARLEPEVAKLDMSLVRGVHAEVTKQRLIRSVASLCAEMKIQVIAEGVETQAERDTLLGLGCDLLQGYLFARPERTLPAVKW
jgi:EAL domain-containing protein (putative c-di-GMP-specific phosphodiesterase class I)